jgi:hypothetical protein
MDAINSLKVKTIVICGSVVCLLIAFPYFFAGSPSTQNTPSYADCTFRYSFFMHILSFPLTAVKFPIEARCRIPQGEHNGAGLVSFTQLNPEGKLHVRQFIINSKRSTETKISVTIDGLKKGEHGFHIHEFGNLGDVSNCILCPNVIVFHQGMQSRWSTLQSIQ